MLIEDYFKNEKCDSKRGEVFRKLLLHYHPDKNKNLDEQTARDVFQFLQERKKSFKGPA